MLNDDFIDYRPIENACLTAPHGRRDASHIDVYEPDFVSSCEWLRTQCEYAKICDKISKSLFSQRGLQQDIDTTMRTADQLLNLLNCWADINSTSSPHRRDSVPREDGNYMAIDVHSRRMTTHIYQSCMAKFIIHGRCLQIQDKLRSQVSIDIFNKCQEECLTAARNFIQTISDINFEGLVVYM